MAFLPPAVFNITANASQAIATMSQVNAQLKVMEAQATRAGTSLSAMTKTATLATAAFKGLGLITAGFAAYGIKEIMDLQQALNQLGQAMNNVGVASKENLASVRALLDEYENLGFDAADSAKAYRSLITATGDVTKANELLKTSTDLARASGMGIADAAQTLARAQTGSARAFREFGITLDSTLPKAQAVDKAMMELNARIGGQAVAFSKTFRGQLEILNVKIQGLAEGIGLILLPKIIAFIDGLGKLYNWLKQNQEALVVIAGLLSGVVLIAVVNLTRKLYEMAIAWAAANWQMTLIIAAITATIAGFTYLWNNFEGFRKGVVRGMQAILNVFAFFLRATGLIGEAFLNLALGPIKSFLNVLGYFVPSAKQAAQAIETLPRTVGDWFDKTADKVNNFADSIAGLSDKKINIKLGLPSLGIGTTGPAGLFTPTVDAEEAKKQADALKKLKDLYEKRAQIIRDGEEKLQKIRADYAEKVADIQKDYTKRVVDAQKEAAKRTAEIVKQSIDQLRNAFRTATYRGVGDLYDALTFQGRYAAGGTITALIGGLSKTLNKAQQLSQNAASLAGLGFTQAFIEEVIAQGPDIGNKLAEQILNSTPEQVIELQKTWESLNKVSSHGVDNLGQQLNSGMKLVTEELQQQLNQVSIDLNDTLASLATDLSESLAEAAKNFQESMAEAQKAIAESLAEINKDIKETISLLGQLASARAGAGIPGAGGKPGTTPSTTTGGGTTYKGTPVAGSVTAGQAKFQITQTFVNPNLSPSVISQAASWAIRTASDGVYSVPKVAPKSALSATSTKG